MNPENHELEQLRRAYSELQLRVTRFSAVEQELINTRDLLDHELEMYKRLDTFNRSALRAGDSEDFLRQVTEAIIDVFELESSVVYVERPGNVSEHVLTTESLVRTVEDEELFIRSVRELSSLSRKRHSVVLEVSDLEQVDGFNDYQNGLIVCIEEPSLNLNIYLLGLISKKNAPLYAKRQTSRGTIFGVFSRQVLALISNRQQQRQITEQIRQIKATDIELKKLSLIATKTKNGVIITDNLGRVEWVNESFEHTSGWKLEEVKGKKPKDFLQREGTDPMVLERLRKSLQEKENVEVIIINYNREGKPYYNQLEITPVFDEQGNHINFIALQKDITAETMFRQEILRINSRFEIITSKSNIGIWEFRPHEQRLVWNEVLLRQYGIDDGYDQSRLFDFWKDAIHPEDRARIVSEVDQLYTSDTEMIEQEFRIVRHDNDDVRILSCLVIAERDTDGVLVRLFGTSVDVTESRNAESRMMQKNEELKKINAELDNFVYSISHDLRAPLLSIHGILSLLRESDELNDKNRNYIDLAMSSTDRLDGTIQEILDYSRNARLELRISEFDLEKTVREIFDDLRFSCPDNMTMTLDTEGDMKIRSDQYRLNTVLKNVISNAVKYHRTGIPDPQVTVQVKAHGNTAHITVKDNGMGIPPESLSRVFEMFFRGKSAVPGTGLGLYICKEILNKMKGTIEMESAERQGTTVRITVPISR
jgi:PAS domain S-box-containing protein